MYRDGAGCDEFAALNLIYVVLQAVQGHIELHDGGNGDDGPCFSDAELNDLVLSGNQGIVELLQNHRALTPRHLRPGTVVERFSGRGNGGVGVGGRSNRHLANGLLGGRVDHGVGFATLRFNPAATNVK